MSAATNASRAACSGATSPQVPVSAHARLPGSRHSTNAKSGSVGLAKGIPKEITWAYESGGLDQVGCVYTAQGFEFDYVGVIFGRDLVYDWARRDWVGVKEESHDSEVKRSGDKFTDLVKSTYRVLLTRGMKGCYVHFVDKDSERFLRSRLGGP